MPRWNDLSDALDIAADEIKTDLEQFVVPDFVPEATRIVLLLESPHTAEIQCDPKHPLAGSSGRNVTEAIRCRICNFGHSAVLGCLLKHSNVRHPVLNGIGVMNVSELPLQEKPYQRMLDQNCRRKYGRLLACFRCIKRELGKLIDISNDPSDTFCSDVTPRIFSAIEQGLKDRLMGLPQSSCVVPCGHVARNFFRRVFQAPDIQSRRIVEYQGKVPHPARKNWAKSCNIPAVDALVHRLQE